MIKLSKKVLNILANYENDPPAVRAKLAQILTTGKLSNTGKLIILPVDQGFEHGPIKSFAINPPAYDPEYHINLAINAGLSAYAAPKGMLECIADKHRIIPLILKANSAHALVGAAMQPNQAMTGSVSDAIYLGCAAIGFTIYPGSDDSLQMIEEVSEAIAEAKANGLATVVWAYPRGGDLHKNDETSVNIISYSAHIAALIGANIIKVKLPSTEVNVNDQKSSIQQPIDPLINSIKQIMLSAFCGKRIVLFSGGPSKQDTDLYQEMRAINCGGGNGSIIGRNTFQRPYDEAIEMLSKIIHIYKTSHTM